MPLTLSPLTAISPIDGRYARQTEILREHFSEQALMRSRLQVEVAWLAALAAAPDIPEVAPMTDSARDFLKAVVDGFDSGAAEQIKRIESTTNHDVKAIEYFLKERMAGHPQLEPLIEFVHFACTSEDINNLAYTLMIRDARREVILPELAKVEAMLEKLTGALAAQPMLARTHGQPATPTTMGKEIANTLVRLRRQRDQFSNCALLGKINGAVGNYNAHMVAYPDVDWPALAARMLGSLGVESNTHTTQIEPHDHLAELFHALSRLNTVLIDASRDLWGYISLGYFRQRLVAGEVGSSTMPHKVNPIDFENAEGNLGLANALFDHLAGKLPISRFQRDLTDSTVLRNMGVAFSWSLIGYRSFLRGLGKLEIDPAMLEADLNANWEVLAEAVQTVMRRHGIPEPYEKLKELTRGRRIDAEMLRIFIGNLNLPEKASKSLEDLLPSTYTGLAQTLAEQVLSKSDVGSEPAADSGAETGPIGIRPPS
jgi:adenylosuccinate lyase